MIREDFLPFIQPTHNNKHPTTKRDSTLAISFVPGVKIMFPIAPVLPVAMQSMLDKTKTDLEWHVLVTQYDKEVKETEKKEYMKKVAIPAFVGEQINIR